MEIVGILLLLQFIARMMAPLDECSHSVLTVVDLSYDSCVVVWIAIRRLRLRQELAPAEKGLAIAVLPFLWVFVAVPGAWFFCFLLQ